MSGESSMKNAIPRRAHRERAQPAGRKKFGLLEKHKDYIERSKDYKKKKNFIKVLKSKAAERNSDEFYYKMHNSQVVDGLHTKLTNSLDNESIKLLKTQDMGYIVYKKAVDDRKIEKLKQNLHLISQERPSNRKIFVDSSTEVEAYTPMSSRSSTNKVIPRELNSASEDKNARKKRKQLRKSISKEVASSYRELEMREERSKQLKTAINALHLQRNLLGKGSKRKIIVTDEDGKVLNDDDDGNDSREKKKVVFKWKRERQR